jgi:uncharacterized membrane protein YgcG
VVSLKRHRAALGIAAVAAWSFLVFASLAGLASAANAAPAAGPPYPSPVTGQRVYDYAGIFSPETVSAAQKIIEGIEARTGAQVAVYTQVKPESDSLDLANADARALMDQWGVGRKGFDDGLVIMFDMKTNLLNGEVSLYAGVGYRAAFLSDSDRQTIFDNDMKPLLASGDLDAGLMAGLRAIDANATPEHAANLERGRQINALILVAALFVGVVLILVAVLRWLRHGRDPVYLDDASIYLPAPPDGLTPAMATLLLDDRTSHRTVTAGLLDLAAHGAIAFRQEHRQVGGKPVHAGIAYLGDGDGKLQDPERKVLDDIVAKSKKYDDYINASRLYRLSEAFDAFGKQLEDVAVTKRWLADKPSRVVNLWGAIGCLELVLAGTAGFVLFFVMISSLLVLTAGLAVAGAVTLGLARFMPARTRQGAMLYAMLSAYKRTMAASLTASSTMDEVVARHALPWVKTPDEAMVWGVALGLDTEIELVMSRSLWAARESAADPTHYWYPSWWTLAGHSSGGQAGGPVSFSRESAGLFSSSPMPDFGSVVAALGSIPSSPAPASSSSGGSGSSFSGGSFGGGGGGGGGGAGGGF